MGWIKRSEQLPKPGDDVLITNGKDVWVDNISTPSDYFIDGFCPNVIDGEVTHWMPLPKPPLRDYQKHNIDETGGVIYMPTGAGKS